MLCGHSLGAAVASIVGMILRADHQFKNIEVSSYFLTLLVRLRWLAGAHFCICASSDICNGQFDTSSCEWDFGFRAAGVLASLLLCVLVSSQSMVSNTVVVESPHTLSTRP